MTRNELSQLEVRINIKVLWTIVASIVIGTASVVWMYSRVISKIEIMQYQIEQLQKK